MKKFKCKNGEIVWVENYNKKDTDIIIHYKGGKYKRSIDIIGKTIFPIIKTNKNQSQTIKRGIQIGQTVVIKNCSNNEILTVNICSVHSEKRYKRMGGSYYGNSVDVSFVGDNTGFNDGIFNISAVSPLGKSLLNRHCNEEIAVSLPNKLVEKYKIICIRWYSE